MAAKLHSPLFLRTVTLVRAIPAGKVLSYGQVARLISAPGCARHVSYVLSSSSKKHKLPWHRVIGANGRLSKHSATHRQLRRLKREGVTFEGDLVNAQRHTWAPSDSILKTLLKDLPEHSPIRTKK